MLDPVFGTVHVTIPPGLDFAALRVARTADGRFTFCRDAVRRVCAASGLPFGLFCEPYTDNAVELIYGWYCQHRAAGGRPDAVFEDVLALARAMGEFEAETAPLHPPH